MKRFFSFGKGKKNASPDGSGKRSMLTRSPSGAEITGGYVVREKDLSKLHKAAWAGDLTKVKQLAKKDASPLDKQNRTPLHLACARGHHQVAQELLEWKAKLNVGDNDARTPLMKAVQCGHLPCVELIMQEAKVDPNTQDQDGESCLHYVGRDGSFDILQLLLENEKTLLDITSKTGLTPLMLAAQKNNLQVAQLLLDEGADPDAQDDDGRTPLMHACQEGQVGLVKLLLQYQAKVNLKDAKGWTADDIAIMASQDACRDLLAGFARQRSLPGSQGTTPTHQPIASNVPGGPSVEAEDDVSQVEDSASKRSEAAGGALDSWGDTDEESELEARRKSEESTPEKRLGAPPPPPCDEIQEQDETDSSDDDDDDDDDEEEEKIPGLDLTKMLKDSDDSLDKPEKPSTGPATPALGLPSTGPTAPALGSPAPQEQQRVHMKDSILPLSARSQPSARSALSFGEDKTWSDGEEESLFSSHHDPSGKKPSLTKTQQGARVHTVEEDERTENDAWSDVESLPMHSARTPRDKQLRGIKDMPTKPSPKNESDFDDSDEEDEEGPGSPQREPTSPAKGLSGSPLASSTRKESDKGFMGISRERHQAMLAELGLDDISDVSDPDLSESEAPALPSSPPPLVKPLGESLGFPIIDHESEWDDTEPSKTPRSKPPASARSLGSGWDSSVAEDVAENAPPLSRPQVTQQGVETFFMVQDLETDVEHDLGIPPPPQFGPDPTIRGRDVDMWDSDDSMVVSEASNQSSNSVKRRDIPIIEPPQSDSVKHRDIPTVEPAHPDLATLHQSSDTVNHEDIPTVEPAQLDSATLHQSSNSVRHEDIPTVEPAQLDSTTLHQSSKSVKLQQLAEPEVSLTQSESSDLGNKVCEIQRNSDPVSRQASKIFLTKRVSESSGFDSTEECEAEGSTSSSSSTKLHHKACSPVLSDHADRKTRSPALSDHADMEARSPALSDHADMEAHSPTLSDHADMEAHSPVLSDHADREAHSPTLSDHADREAHSPTLSDHADMEAHPPVLSDHTEGEPRSPALSDHADMEAHSPTLSDHADMEAHSPVLSDHADREAHSPTLSDHADMEAHSPTLSDHADMEAHPPVLSDHTEGEPRSPALSDHADREAHSPALSDHANWLHNEAAKSGPSPGSVEGKMEDSADEWDNDVEVAASPRVVPPDEQKSSIKKNVDQDDDEWDSDPEVDASPRSRTSDDPAKHPGEKNINSMNVAETVTKSGQPLTDWDSDDDNLSLPAAMHCSQSPSKAAVPPGDLQQKVDAEEEDDDSKWDSDVELPLSSAPDHKKAAPVASMYGMDDDTEEEEEEESTWEKDSKLKKGVSEQQTSVGRLSTRQLSSGSDKEEERQQQWEEDYQQRQEQLRKEAKEELQKEHEDLELLHEQQEEERREEEQREGQRQEEERKKEEERKQEALRQEEERKKEEERKQEAQRQEEERKKEEERKREAQRQEEERKKEEERKQEAQRQEEERKKEEERKREAQRQEEERKKEEELKREALRQEEERKKEEERKREAQRQEVERKQKDKEQKIEDARRRDAEEQQRRKEREELEREELKIRETRVEEHRTKVQLQEDSNQRKQHTDGLLAIHTQRTTVHVEHHVDSSPRHDLHQDGQQSHLVVEGRQRTTSTFSHADDEDTFNGIDMPDLDHVARRDTSMAVGMYHADADDDCLSYSSTEHDVSVHDGHTAGLGSSGPLSFSLTNDSIGVMRAQEQLRDARRHLDRERSTRTSLENRRKNLEKEKAELIHKLEEVMRARSGLEQTKIDMEAKIRSIQYNLNEETEQRKNLDVLYSKTKEQLARKEDQYTQEVEAKQKADLAMRNLQMELRTALSGIKQLEDEKEDLLRQMAHEKSARLLQEQINEDQQKLQAALAMQDDPDKLNQNSLHEELTDVLTRLEAVDENRKLAQDTVDRQRAEIYALKMELDRQRARHKDDHSLLSVENEELHTKIEELKNEVKLNEEALAHATMQYNLQLTQLRTETTVTSSNLDKEKTSREKLETEVQSLKTRLQTTCTELDKCQVARSELERNNHKEHEEWNRLLERRDNEVTGLKEQNQTLSQRLSTADSKVTSVENELHIANATLVERSNQLQTLQRELEQRRSAQDSQEENYRKEKDDNVRLQARVESLQDKIGSLQHETLALRQQLDDSRLRSSDHKADSQDKLTHMLDTLRSDHDKARSSLEEKNASLNETVVRLREELRASDTRRTALEQEWRQVQAELNDTHKKLSLAQATLDVSSKAKDQLESERTNLRAEVDRIQSKLEVSREKQTEAQARVAELTEKLERAELNKEMTSQQLASHTASAQASAKSKGALESPDKGQLEEAYRQMDKENTEMKMELKHERQQREQLQQELSEAQGVRTTMNTLLSNLKSSNAHMEEKLTKLSGATDEAAKLRDHNTKLVYQMNEAAHVEKQATHEAEDARGLWESEVKSRSKLGLRIARLEREKQEWTEKLEEERRKMRKAMELKKNAETKLEAEQDKSIRLQKELTTLKTHLKTSRKRLKDLDTSENQVNILQSDFNKERMEMDRTMVSLKRQLLEMRVRLADEKNIKELEDVSKQLATEVEQKQHLDQRSHQLQLDVSSLRETEKKYARLEKARRKAEQDLTAYKSHVAENFLEKSALEQLKAELEARSRLELNQKLEEVNAYLEEQAQARQRLDTLRDDNESSLRKEFNKTKKELLEELNSLRNSHAKALSEKENYDTETTRLQELYQNEIKLRERLAERLSKATEKASQAQFYLEQQRVQPVLTESTPPSGWLNNGNSIILGKSPQNHGVNDFSHTIRAQLDRSIAKHMEKGPTVDISLPLRSLDDNFLSTSSYKKSSSDYLDVLKKNYML